MLASSGCYAQEDAHLKKLTGDLVHIRQVNSLGDALNNVVISWSSSGCPKMTLMDEIRRDTANEYHGSGAYKFKINQVVTHVYNRQNTGMVSKGDYFNSTEKEIYYSAIEKNVKEGQTVTYTLIGHVGSQEFVFVSYNPSTAFVAKVNDMEAKTIGEGVQCLKMGLVAKDEEIVFSITNKSNSNESFVILNHNPQK